MDGRPVDQLRRRKDGKTKMGLKRCCLWGRWFLAERQGRVSLWRCIECLREFRSVRGGTL